MSATYDIILFGGDGDLSLRKLMPALYRAEVNQELDQDLRIITTAFGDSVNRDEFVAKIQHWLEKQLPDRQFNPGHWKTFSRRITPVALDIVDLTKGWTELSKLVNDSDHECMFYFAIPPSLFAKTCENLAAHQLITDKSRVILEKPIGYDRASAEIINNSVGS